MTDSNLGRAQAICDWAEVEKMADKGLAHGMLLTGIMHALTAQAESLHSAPYGSGEDTFSVLVTGDNRDQLLMAAFFEARSFFGPGRELKVDEPWGASRNPFLKLRTLQPRDQGFYSATIVMREKRDDED